MGRPTSYGPLPQTLNWRRAVLVGYRPRTVTAYNRGYITGYTLPLHEYYPTVTGCVLCFHPAEGGRT